MADYSQQIQEQRQSFEKALSQYEAAKSPFTTAQIYGGAAGKPQTFIQRQAYGQQIRQAIKNIQQQQTQYEQEVAKYAPEMAFPQYLEAAYTEALSKVTPKVEQLQKEIENYQRELSKETNKEYKRDYKNWIREAEAELNVYKGALSNKTQLVKDYFSGNLDARANYERQVAAAKARRGDLERQKAKEMGISLTEYRNLLSGRVNQPTTTYEKITALLKQNPELQKMTAGEVTDIARALGIMPSFEGMKSTPGFQVVKTPEGVRYYKEVPSSDGVTQKEISMNTGSAIELAALTKYGADLASTLTPKQQREVIAGFIAPTLTKGERGGLMGYYYDVVKPYYQNVIAPKISSFFQSTPKPDTTLVYIPQPTAMYAAGKVPEPQKALVPIKEQELSSYYIPQSRGTYVPNLPISEQWWLNPREVKSMTWGEVMATPGRAILGVSEFFGKGLSNWANLFPEELKFERKLPEEPKMFGTYTISPYERKLLQTIPAPETEFEKTLKKVMEERGIKEESTPKDIALFGKPTSSGISFAGEKYYTIPIRPYAEKGLYIVGASTPLIAGELATSGAATYVYGGAGVGLMASKETTPQEKFAGAILTIPAIVKGIKYLKTEKPILTREEVIIKRAGAQEEPILGFKDLEKGTRYRFQSPTPGKEPFILQKTPELGLKTETYAGYRTVVSKATPFRSFLESLGKSKYMPEEYREFFLDVGKPKLVYSGTYTPSTKASYQEALKLIQKYYGVSESKARALIREVRPQLIEKSYIGESIMSEKGTFFRQGVLTKDPLRIKLTSETGEVFRTGGQRQVEGVSAIGKRITLESGNEAYGFVQARAKMVKGNVRMDVDEALALVKQTEKLQRGMFEIPAPEGYSFYRGTVYQKTKPSRGVFDVIIKEGEPKVDITIESPLKVIQKGSGVKTTTLEKGTVDLDKTITKNLVGASSKGASAGALETKSSTQAAMEVMTKNLLETTPKPTPKFEIPAPKQTRELAFMVKLSEPKLSEKQILKMDEALSQKTITKGEVKFKEVLVSKQIPKIKEELVPALKTTEVQAEKLVNVPVEVTVPKVTLEIPPTTTFTRPKIIPPKIEEIPQFKPFTLIQLPKPPRQVQEARAKEIKTGFDVLIKRRGKEIPIAESLPYPSAVAVGARALKQSLAASARLVPSKKPLKDIKIAPPKLAEFRFGTIKRGKLKYDPLKIVQKRSFRLGTPFEVREIQAARRGSLL